MEPTKACPRCKQELPLTSFHVRKAAKSGRNPYCKACVAVYSSKYYLENPDKLKAWQRKYYRKVIVDPAVKRRRRESDLLWFRTDAAKDSNRRYRESEKGKAAILRRRLREENAPGGAFEANRQKGAYQPRIDLYFGMCAYCEIRPYKELDHAIPLARGGTNWPSNLYPACMHRDCSKGKVSKILHKEWVPPKARSPNKS